VVLDYLSKELGVTLNDEMLERFKREHKFKIWLATTPMGGEPSAETWEYLSSYGLDVTDEFAFRRQLISVLDEHGLNVRIQMPALGLAFGADI
jgi:hypothetical protein